MTCGVRLADQVALVPWILAGLPGADRAIETLQLQL